MQKLIFIALFLLLAVYGYCQDGKTVLLKDTASENSITKKTFEMQQVEVSARLKDANIKSGSTGISVNVKEIKMLPRLVGEADPYKALQYMGGVSQAGEANSGMYVRGGNNDQNLILLNGSPIQNPTHVLGIFSVFNPDLMDQMKFMKSGIPAEYGGRLSSVVDISTCTTIPEKIKVDGSLGLISSRLSSQIPIGKNFSMYGSIRGSYISSIILPTLTLFGIDSLLTQNKYEFWDANTGFNWKLSGKTKISGHFYTGRDDIKIMQLKRYNFDENSTYWQNTTAGLELYHQFDENFSMKQQLNFSKFDIRAELNWFESNNILSSEFQNYSWKADFTKVHGIHNFRFGTELSYHLSYPHFVRTDSVIPIEVDNQHNNIFSGLISAYFRDEFEVGKWQFNLGLRAGIYAHMGKYTDFATGTAYASNELIKTYNGFEPRFYTRYLLNENTSLKLSASHHIQYLNQIPVFSFGIPADLQIPASLYIKPQNSWHFSGGYFRNFHHNDWEVSWEVYYKTLQNQLEFNSGIAEVFTNGNIEQNLLVGKGETYGSEWKIRKNAGKFTGWLAYNLAWSYRQFDDLNGGKPFLARNDRRHDISVIGMYTLNDRWNFSAVFVYATGSRLNLPVSWYVVDNKVVLEYCNYNAFEMPAYHRLDLSANLKLKEIKGYASELNFSVYNIYNRANPFQVFYNTKVTEGDRFNFNLKMSYLLPVIPSVSYVFHF